MQKMHEREREKMIQKGILLGVFVVAAWNDWKEQKIHLYLLSGAAILGIFCYIFAGNLTVAELAGGVLTGIILTGISLLGNGCIGAGDGVMFIVSGIFLGFRNNLRLLLGALLLSGIVAFYLLVIKKKDANMRMPFLPFVLAVYLMQFF